MAKISDARWANLLEQFHNSDLTQKQFAQKHGLNIYTFRGRLYRASSSDRQNLPAPFVSLQIKDLDQPQPFLKLKLQDLELDFASLPDPQWLAQLAFYTRGS